eukprot:767453-Hanusia_phi.AAC.1
MRQPPLRSAGAGHSEPRTRDSRLWPGPGPAPSLAQISKFGGFSSYPLHFLATGRAGNANQWGASMGMASERRRGGEEERRRGGETKTCVRGKDIIGRWKMWFH